jgi:ORF6N domain
MTTNKTDIHPLIPLERIQQCIYLLRGEKVMLDKDLAALYGVPTKSLNEQVRRNLDRFPADFMFHLTGEEAARLRSQSATSKEGRGGAR